MGQGWTQWMFLYLMVPGIYENLWFVDKRFNICGRNPEPWNQPQGNCLRFQHNFEDCKVLLVLTQVCASDLYDMKLALLCSLCSQTHGVFQGQILWWLFCNSISSSVLFVLFVCGFRYLLTDHIPPSSISHYCFGLWCFYAMPSITHCENQRPTRAALGLPNRGCCTWQTVAPLEEIRGTCWASGPE